MQFRDSLLTFLAVIAFGTSCNKVNDRDVFQHLTELDAQLDTQPRQVSDSLKTLDVNEFSRSNRVYYNLLKVISDDKTYANFTSDSLINAVNDYYRLHDRKNRNYIRSLAYQGIIRTRMGVKDSTVFEPLKEANRLFQSMEVPDISRIYDQLLFGKYQLQQSELYHGLRLFSSRTRQCKHGKGLHSCIRYLSSALLERDAKKRFRKR